MGDADGPSLVWPPPPPQRTLDEILTAASRNPIYTPLGGGSPTLASFPLLRKARLLATVPKLLYPPFLNHTYISPTGGTRSMDKDHLYIPNDITENRIQRYMFGRLLVATGTFTTTSVVLNCNGGLVMYRSGDLTGGLLQEAGATELAASQNASSAEAIGIARKFGADTVWAPSSKLMELAVWAEQNETYPFRRALFTAEPLSDKQEAFMRRALGVSELGSIYGSAECGPVGVCPPTSEKSRTFVVDKAMFVVEIVDSDGNVVASSLSDSPQATGEIVLTSLVRHRYPMVRYATGDHGSIRPHPNGLWILLELAGRDPEKSFSVGGDYIDVSEIEARVMDTEVGKGVLEWQVIVTEGPCVEFRVVFGDSGKHQERAGKIHAAIVEHVLGPGLDVTVRPVGYDDLERGARARKVRKTVDKR